MQNRRLDKEAQSQQAKLKGHDKLFEMFKIRGPWDGGDSELTPSSFQICKELQKPCWLSFLD